MRRNLYNVPEFTRGCRVAEVSVWAYCLMPNHVHLILVPADDGGLRRGLGDAHLRYSRRVNFREGWRGYLWQGRFASVAMDEAHLRACARYVELNPVRARLVARPEDWRWSSIHAHLRGTDDGITVAAPLLERAPDWAAFLALGLNSADHDALRTGERTGRPLGSTQFIANLEEQLGRTLVRQRPGRKPASRDAVKSV